MGRRARKRTPLDDPVAGAAPGDGHGSGPGRPAPFSPTGRGERPTAPWHPFPLVELTALAGIGCFIAALVVGLASPSGTVLLVAALIFGSLAGLDTAIREHAAGYRSHSLLLAAVPAVIAAGVLFFARAPWPAVSATGLVLLAGGVVVLRRAFRRASGGLSWR